MGRGHAACGDTPEGLRCMCSVVPALGLTARHPKFYIHFHEHSSADQNMKGGEREDVILLWSQHEWALGNV